MGGIVVLVVGCLVGLLALWIVFSDDHDRWGY